MEWPDRFGLLDAPSLWQSIVRVVRRPDQWEIVALAPTGGDAAAAGVWAAGAATDLVGGSWTQRATPTGAADHHAVRLRVTGTTADPGRPVVANPAAAGRRRSRR